MDADEESPTDLEQEFLALQADAVPRAVDDDSSDEPEIAGEGWSGADIEDAYLKALHALESVELPEDEAVEPAAPLASNAADSEPGTIPFSSPSATTAPPVVGESGSDGLSAGNGKSDPVSNTAPSGMPAGTPSQPAKAPHLQLAGLDERQQISPGQVIEAALFVGGSPLTAKRLCALLRGDFEPSFVEQTIDAMNLQYAAEARPYEIRLGDGGYRMELRPEHERIRNRVYGVGPREVRLSQDVLEVLAFVAYKQPVTRAQLEALGEANAGSLLRQLLRRELIVLQRGENGRDDVKYVTTARFLSLFGLGSLDELPQPEDVELK